MSAQNSVKQRFVKLFKVVAPIIDTLGLFAITILLLSVLPLEVFSKDPATGGDTASHFWPLYELVRENLPNFSVRGWNPGNLGGEPHLVHYFPLPFLAMALLSTVMPLGMAFNLGMLVHILVMPFAAYYCMRGLKYRFPTPIFTALGVTFLQYNEAYTMWGGNITSNLAGQFAHGYAFMFLFLGMGALASEINRREFPWLSALLFAGLFLSHAYVATFLPALFISILFFYPKQDLKFRFKTCFISGLFAFLLSAWFIFPMLQNQPWTTPFAMNWGFSKDIISDIVTPIFSPLFTTIIISSFFVFYLKFKNKLNKNILPQFAFWAFPIFWCVLSYIAFPKLGLVDVRAFPQAILCLCVIAAIGFSFLILKLPRVFSLFLTLPIILLALVFIHSNLRNIPYWMYWNYSGWQAKSLYPDLMKLSSNIRGDFSDPRVIYEHHGDNNGAGTLRVFEMLPYFSGRATMESVYLQASVLAPSAFLLQSEISVSPSCPFSQFDCPKYDISNAVKHFELLGVGDLILVASETRAQADAEKKLKPGPVFGIWQIYSLKEKPSLVGLFNQSPQKLSEYSCLKFYEDDRNEKEVTDPKHYYREMFSNWKRPVSYPPTWQNEFYCWLKNYESENTQMVVSDDTMNEETKNKLQDEKIWKDNENCSATVEVKYNQINLHTTCPGKAHYLKFSYHPTWEADTKDPLFMVSPGFIGIIPSKNDIQIRFGQSSVWTIANATSYITLALLMLCACYKKKD